MARFRYRMQSILDIKNKMETQARMEFGLAQAQLNEEETKLERLYTRKTNYEKKAKELLSDALKVQEIIHTQTAIKRMQEYIAEQKKQVLAATQKVEEARTKLVEVMQERKTHERLKEKAFDTFLQEEKASESKEIDQLTSYTYGKKMTGDE
ncbi:MAG: flagellar export protein FliJ [Lachnospiraceae bacterium]|nr:flagellar export protein FliJ [Lachnospiraceae bacterium]